MTAADIVDAFGGTTVFAAMLGGIPISTVHSWRRTNYIPDWRRAKILGLAAAHGITLSTADFPAPEQRVRAA